MTDPQDFTPVSNQTIDAEPIGDAPRDSSTDDIRVEEFKVSGNDLVDRVRQLFHEGNIRRIIIKNEEGHTLLEIPLTVGVVGGALATVMFPVVAALGAIGALVARLTLVIERKV
jgi:hypothetical protein